VITGALAVMGAFSLAMVMLILFGLRSGWIPYGAYAVAALAGGALVVAHAPLRPWREPAAAGALAVVVMALLLRTLDLTLFGWSHSWPVTAGIAAGSGVLAGLGGLAARRTVAGIRTDLLIALSMCVMAGTTVVTVRLTDGLLGGLLAIPAGGFITQAAIPYRRPWTCGLGAGMFVTSVLSNDLSAIVVGSVLVAWPFMVLLGYLGARVACRILGRGDAPAGAEVPSARVG
jgi:hypothetical protein